MKARIVAIGNSQGIRIPRPLLEKSGLHGEVELSAKKGMLVVQAASRPRGGWADAFRDMGNHQDDRLVDDPVGPATSWDDEEWSW